MIPITVPLRKIYNQKWRLDPTTPSPARKKKIRRKMSLSEAETKLLLLPPGRKNKE
jgi:hypothetical protein